MVSIPPLVFLVVFSLIELISPNEVGLKIVHPREHDVFLFRDVEFMFTLIDSASLETSPSIYPSLGLEVCVTASYSLNSLDSSCLELRNQYLHFKFPESFSDINEPITVSISLRPQGSNTFVSMSSVLVYVRPYEISTRKHLTPSDLSTPLSQPRTNPPAYFTLLTDDSYLQGVVALYHSLQQVDSNYNLHVIIPALANQNSKNSSLTVSSSALSTLSSLSIETHPVSTSFASKLPVGSMAPQLNQTQWLKLELWNLTSFSRILYLDADTIVTANIDELLESPSLSHFSCVGDYFAGSVFLVFPSTNIFEQLRSKSSSGGKYLYGEQDFLNDFFRRNKTTGTETRHVLSPFNYHCMAEDFGYPDRLPNPTSTCKIVEFASCNRDDTSGVRWKPWMDRTLLRGKICSRYPTEMFWELINFYQTLFNKA